MAAEGLGKKRNRLGSGSLVAAVAGFLVVEFQPWLPLDSLILFGGLSLKGLLGAFFEASMVGATADWFAVTALFKDPLGIRLPHTSILAKNKDAIADAIPRFLTGFVSPEAMRMELGKIDYAAKASEALSAGGIREELHAFLRSRAAAFLQGFGGADADRSASLRRFSDELLGFASERVDAPAQASALLAWARRERFDERAVAAIAEYARASIGRNRVRLVALLTPMIKRNAGWQGLFIGAGTVERFIAGMQDELAEMRADAGNDFRRFIITSLGEYASELGSDGPARAKMAEGFRAALADEGFRSGFAAFLSLLLSGAGDELSGEEGRFISTLEGIEDALAARLSADEALRARLNSLAASLLAMAIERGKVIEGVTDYLAGLLKSFDARSFVSRVEDAVWNDLQYIRVNGAVVGGFVGLAIALAKAAIGG